MHYWSLTIRSFSVIFRKFDGGVSYPFADVKSVYYTAPADLAKMKLVNVEVMKGSVEHVNLLLII